MTEEVLLRMSDKISAAQRKVCATFGANFLDCPAGTRLGVSPNLRDGGFPIHGVRVAPMGESAGWYIWAGDGADDYPEFFLPVDGAVLQQWAPIALPFLGLGPGWRFLLSEDDVQVWQEPQDGAVLSA